MKNPMSLIAMAYSGVALASYIAVRSFAGALEEMGAVGGGIAAITLGAGEATRFPLVASWIAAVATVVAIILVVLAIRRSGANADAAASPRLLWSAGLSLVVGIASVLLFRGVIEYVLAVAIPGSQPQGVNAANAGEAVSSRITLVSIAIAICFAIAVAQLIYELRLSRGAMLSRATLRFNAAALAVSLGVLTMLVIHLQAYSSRHLNVALRGAPVNTVLE
jgi:hypothetical protein